MCLSVYPAISSDIIDIISAYFSRSCCDGLLSLEQISWLDALQHLPFKETSCSHILPRPDQNRLQGNHKYGSLAWVLRRMAWGDADGSRAARFSVFLPAKWPMTSQFLFAIDWEKWRHVETATPRQVFWTSGEGLLMRLCHWAIGDWGPKSSKGENWGFMSVEPSAYDQFVVVFVGRSDDMPGWFR